MTALLYVAAIYCIARGGIGLYFWAKLRKLDRSIAEKQRRLRELSG